MTIFTSSSISDYDLWMRYSSLYRFLLLLTSHRQVYTLTLIPSLSDYILYSVDRKENGDDEEKEKEPASSSKDEDADN